MEQDLSRVEVVYFDLGGTLLHPISVGEVYSRIGAKHGSKVDAKVALDQFRIAFRRQEELDRAASWKTDARREKERWHAIVRETLPDLIDFDRCFDELYRFYASADGWTLDTDAPSLLADLQRLGLKSGIASNYDERLFQVIAGVPSLARMTPIVVSSQVGYRKPAREFFHAMEDAAGVTRDRILLVGDDVESDYLGARASGMKAILLDPKGKQWNSSFRRVQNLREIAVLVE